MKMSLPVIATAILLGAIATPALAQSTATGNLNVRITINQQCLVNAGSGGTGGGDAVLDFGSTGVLNANIDQQTVLNGTGAIQVQCTAGTSYSIGLSAGANAATANDVSTRRMASGDAFVAYQLYQDAGRSSVWGHTIGTDTLAATADGSVLSVPVFGRVPPQATPAAGTYTDLVVVTVTY